MGRFLSCYLLSSLNPKGKGRTYIGFTPNPAQRLRKHNGEIVGGAFKTRKLRPWEMVLVVYGFPTKVQALQFEWAWQHPDRSKAVREAARKLGSRGQMGLQGKVRLLFEMLGCEPWCLFPLNVQILDTKYEALQLQCSPPPGHVAVTCGPMDTLPVALDASDAEDGQGGGDGEDGAVSGGTSVLGAEDGGLSQHWPMSQGGGVSMAGLSQGGVAGWESDSSYQGLFGDSGLITGGSQLPGASVEGGVVLTQDTAGGGVAGRKRACQHPCAVCGKDASSGWAGCAAGTPGCPGKVHMRCLADVFSSRGSVTDSGLPLTGPCPVCGGAGTWLQALEAGGSVGWGNGGSKRQRGRKRATRKTSERKTQAEGAAEAASRQATPVKKKARAPARKGGSRAASPAAGGSEGGGNRLGEDWAVIDLCDNSPSQVEDDAGGAGLRSGTASPSRRDEGRAAEGGVLNDPESPGYAMFDGQNPKWGTFADLPTPPETPEKDEVRRGGRAAPGRGGAAAGGDKSDESPPLQLSLRERLLQVQARMHQTLPTPPNAGGAPAEATATKRAADQPESAQCGDGDVDATPAPPTRSRIRPPQRTSGARADIVLSSSDSSGDDDVGLAERLARRRPDAGTSPPLAVPDTTPRPGRRSAGGAPRAAETVIEFLDDSD
ncbi:unnamed protein product [Pedinophyceae sp. YPF-701]|nr:unnamed protein product [Pedinophyceae sp. YPF-701]